MAWSWAAIIISIIILHLFIYLFSFGKELLFDLHFWKQITFDSW